MRICVEVYGCAANQGDADIVKGLLLVHGYELVVEAKQADVVVLMTCIVIQTTHQRMIHRINTLQKEGKKVILGGCLPAALPDQAKKIAPGSPLMTPRSIHNIISLLNGCNPPSIEVDKAGLPRLTGMTTTIPIADGCLQACSYCITRRARGILTSYKMDELIKAADHAFRHGCRELRLSTRYSCLWYGHWHLIGFINIPNIGY